jgi:hypothetical protein
LILRLSARAPCPPAPVHALVEHVRRALAATLLVLWPLSASAQGPIADAGNDLEALQAEIDRDYAEALANDCAMACRALESMRHAADHLCALDAGDRCVQAQGKVREASERIRAACPSCPQAMGPSSPPPAEPSSATDTALEAAPSKRGGCAGCTLSPVDGGRLSPLAIAAALLLTLRRRRTRR